MCFFAVPPKIEDSQSSSDKVRTEGSDVTLQCHATGSPKPTVTWKRENGTPINIDKANNISGKHNSPFSYGVLVMKFRLCSFFFRKSKLVRF